MRRMNSNSIGNLCGKKIHYERWRFPGGTSNMFVTPSEFRFKTKMKTVTLKDLGDGVGTFEDAYGLPVF